MQKIYVKHSLNFRESNSLMQPPAPTFLKIRSNIIIYVLFYVNYEKNEKTH